MLFKVEFNKDVFELNPELKSIENFYHLTDRQMKYVILATDYKSPFRKLPIEGRKKEAALAAGYSLEKDGKRLDMNARDVIAGKNVKIEAAIRKYMEIQHDEDTETYKSICNLIEQVKNANNLENKSLADLKAVVEMNTGKLDKLMETKKKLEEILELREEAPQVSLEQDDDTLNEESLPLLAQFNQNML